MIQVQETLDKVSVKSILVQENWALRRPVHHTQALHRQTPSKATLVPTISNDKCDVFLAMGQSYLLAKACNKVTNTSRDKLY